MILRNYSALINNEPGLNLTGIFLAGIQEIRSTIKSSAETFPVSHLLFRIIFLKLNATFLFRCQAAKAAKHRHLFPFWSAHILISVLFPFKDAINRQEDDLQVKP